MIERLRELVPRFIRRSYALKFGIALVVLGLAVGAIGLVGTAQIQDGVQSNVHDDHATLAHQQSEAIDDFHSENKRTAESFTRTGMLNDSQAVVQEYIETEIQNRGEGRTGGRHLHLIDIDGDVIASSKVEPGDGLQGQWVNELETNRTYVTGAYESASDDGTIPRIAYVTDAGGVPDDTVLAYTVPLDEYSVSTSDGTYTMVVDETDTIVFDEPGSELLPSSTSAMLETYDEDETVLTDARDLPDDEASAVETGPASGFLADDFFEGEYVVGYASIPGTDWVVLVHTPTRLAYGFVEDVRLYGALATIGAVVLIGGIGAVIGWNTSRSIDQLTQKAARIEDGDLDVELDSQRIDSIGQLYDGFDSMRVSLKNRISEVRRASEEAKAARAETERINRHLETKADEYSAVMQVCADGDLTARMDPESENEAMTEIATEFNAMLAELEATTAHVKRFATVVASASEQVTASTEEVQSASEQVATSVEEISDGADQQNQHLHAVSNEMSNLSTTTEQIAASSNEVADLAEQTAETGRLGRRDAQEAIDGMHEIESESVEAVEAIEALEEEIGQIDELLEFITEVAHQTNMLALNANIEASRGNAGDGDGFDVVASQVKELAEDTKETAEDIEKRLDRINERTDHTAAEVQQTADRISTHVDSVENAVTALDEIAEYANQTNDGVQEISAVTEEQAASTQEVVAMTSAATDISETTAQEAQHAAAAAEEQTSSLAEVSESVSSLAGQAIHLSETLDRFETDQQDQFQALDVDTESSTTGGEQGTADDVQSDTNDDRTGADEGPAGGDDDPTEEDDSSVSESDVSTPTRADESFTFNQIDET